jgi:hypothetical protein
LDLADLALQQLPLLLQIGNALLESVCFDLGGVVLLPDFDDDCGDFLLLIVELIGFGCVEVFLIEQVLDVVLPVWWVRYLMAL